LPRVRTAAPSGTIPMVHDPTGHRNSTPKAAVTTTPPVNGVTTAPDAVMKINRAAPGLVRTRGNPNPPPAVAVATTGATNPPTTAPEPGTKIPGTATTNQTIRRKETPKTRRSINQK